MNAMSNAKPPDINPKNRHKHRRFKCLLSAVFLLLIAVSAAAAVFFNPRYLLPVFEHMLRQQQMTADIRDLEADFQWPTYTLVGTTALRGAGYDVHQAKLQTTLNIAALWQGKAFVENAELTQLHAELDLNRLREQFGTHKSSTSHWQRFVPHQWRIACESCQLVMSPYRFTGEILAQGQGIQQVSTELNDDNGNHLTAVYDAESQSVMLSSQQLNLRHFSQYEAQLRQTEATLLLNSPWQSSLTAELYYQGLNSHINLQGEGENHLRLQTHTQGKTLTVQAKKNNDTIVLHSDAVDLGLLNIVKPVLLPILGKSLSTPMYHRLQQTHISGQVGGTIKLIKTSADTYQPDSIALQLNELTATDGKQSISGLSGTVRFTQAQWQVDLSLSDSRLRLPAVWETPPAPLTGVIVGQFDQQKQQIQLHQLQLGNKDFKQLKAEGIFSWANRPTLALHGYLEHFALTKLKQYLPKQMPSKTRTWLSKAFTGGKDNRTEFNLNGDLRRFLKDKNFVLKVSSDIKNSRFHYLRNNPDITLKHAKLTIDREKLAINLTAAELFSIINRQRISVPLTGTVNIADMTKAVIDIRASVPARPLSRLVKLAERSIAKKSVQRVQKIADINGNFALELQLLLNVFDKKIKDSFEIKLFSDTANATLKSYPELPIKKGKAQATINQNGLQTLQLDGKLFNQPINIDLSRPPPDKDAGYRVNIQASRVDPLQVLSPLKLLTDKQVKLIKTHRLLTGRDDYQVNVHLQNNGNLQQVQVVSDWQQSAVDLFALVNKKVGKPLPLSLDYQADKRRLNINLGKRLSLAAGLNTAGNLSGLSISNDTSQSPYRQGIAALNLNSKALDLVALRAFHQAFSATETTSKSKQRRLDYVFKINIDHVKITPKQQIPLAINGNLEKLKIASPLLAGTISYRPNQLQADIERAEVNKLFNLVKKQSINPEGRKVTTVDLASALPVMDITVKQLIFKGNNIGKGAVHTSIKDGRYSIDQILVNGKNYYFDASGYEAAEPQGITTRLQADFRGENLDALIKQFKLNEIIDGKFIDMAITLSWPGKAHTLNLRQSYGKAHLNAHNIKLTNLSTNVGGIFGLIDIVGIIRRVALDFQNLASSKLSFDTIEGNWNIGGGRAMTRDAYATGSLVELQLVGAADLYRREFDDMDLTVIPKASNVFPIIGAVAGGVVGGAAGLLVQQTVGDDINRAVGLPYVIAGTWAKPSVDFDGEDKPDNTNTEQIFKDYDTAK